MCHSSGTRYSKNILKKHVQSDVKMQSKQLLPLSSILRIYYRMLPVFATYIHNIVNRIVFLLLMNNAIMFGIILRLGNISSRGKILIRQMSVWQKIYRKNYVNEIFEGFVGRGKTLMKVHLVLTIWELKLILGLQFFTFGPIYRNPEVSEEECGFYTCSVYSVVCRKSK